MDAFKALMNSPVGPRTVHFWGPAANWALVGAAIADSNKPVEQISSRMTTTLFFYSCAFMRFAWMVKPRNILLFSCHFCNASMQLYLLQRKMRHEMKNKTSVSEDLQTATDMMK